MRRHSLTVALLSMLVLVWCASARAEPIHVTSGFADTAAHAPGTIAIFGDGGFSLTGALDSLGRFAPGCCQAPGTVTGFGGTWSGIDLRNMTATYQGLSFTDVGGLNSTTGAFVDFNASAVVVPPWTATGTATLTAPFVLTGSFSFLNPAHQAFLLPLTGGGTGTLTMRPVPNGEWEAVAARYDFSGQAVTPEPSSLLLLGVGALGVYRAGRRRRG
jgi:hypothetical protein